MRRRWLVGLGFLLGCANTLYQPVPGAALLPPTCAAAVRLYPSGQAIGQPYRELATLRAYAWSEAGDSTLWRSLARRAAQLGANGVVYRGADPLAGALTSRQGEALAIWIPGDSAATEAACQGEDRAKPPRDYPHQT